MNTHAGTLLGSASHFGDAGEALETVQCLARNSNQSDLRSSPTMSKLQICVTRCHPGARTLLHSLVWEELQHRDPRRG